MNDRLKALRRALNLTQTEFGGRLGVTNPAISKLELGERNLTDQMILSICREFGVNEEWLRTGNGEMFIENDDTVISSLVAEYGLDDLDRKILEAYVDLSEDTRRAVNVYFSRIAYSFMQEQIDNARNGVLDVIYNSRSVDSAKAEMVGKAITVFSKAFPYVGPGNVEAAEELIPDTAKVDEYHAEWNKGLTEEEAVALIRQRYADAKGGIASSTTYAKAGGE